MHRPPRLEFPNAHYPPSSRATAEMHGILSGSVSEDLVRTAEAERSYADWVEAGRGAQLWKESLRRGRFLGDEAFVERVLRRASRQGAIVRREA